MSQSPDQLASPGLAALHKERAARKSAEREVKKLLADLDLMRDIVQRWERSANSYRNERDLLRAELTKIANSY